MLMFVAHEVLSFFRLFKYLRYVSVLPPSLSLIFTMRPICFSAFLDSGRLSSASEKWSATRPRLSPALPARTLLRGSEATRRAMREWLDRQR